MASPGFSAKQSQFGQAPVKRLKRSERAVLLDLLRSRLFWASRDPRALAASRLTACERGRHGLRTDAARAGRVRPEAIAWLGHVPTDSEFVALSRSYRRLEQLHLLHRHRGPTGRRRVHLSLTPAGERIARDLAGDDATDTPTPEA